MVDIIVVVLASVAKSDSVLMADSLSLEDRSNFSATVITARENFNQLWEAAARYGVTPTDKKLLNSEAPRTRRIAVVTHSSQEARYTVGTPQITINEARHAICGKLWRDYTFDRLKDRVIS